MSAVVLNVHAQEWVVSLQQAPTRYLHAVSSAQSDGGDWFTCWSGGNLEGDVSCGIWLSVINLESSVGRCKRCICGGAGQGTMTRNSYSIPRSCNAAMRHHKCAICTVVLFTYMVNFNADIIFYHFNCLNSVASGLLRNLGSTQSGATLGGSPTTQPLVGITLYREIMEPSATVSSTT